MDQGKWFAQRLTELRMEKGVSARNMSLSLGQSESYINKIENRRTLPSMTGFFYICDYLDISPRDFFDASFRSPKKSAAILDALGKLSASKAEHILQLIEDLTENE